MTEPRPMPAAAEAARQYIPRAGAPPHSIDVIMPAFRGEKATLRAIDCVLAARTQVPFRLVVIDDASPEPTLASRIAELGRSGLLLALRNDSNRGFVATVNAGMRLRSDGDIVLLNADTEVYDGWLDRLHTAAHGDRRIGTVTPLSNAATILSYPLCLRDCHRPLELSAAALDRLAASLAPKPAEIPTAIGFCMYIRRDCLDQTGVFDQAAFGRGYGEENDFCMRAASRGWRHLAATDTYVWHWGGLSFGPEKKQRLRHAMHTMRQLHPGYQALIDAFIQRDPLAPVRAALDIARIRAAATHYQLGANGAGDRGNLRLRRTSIFNDARWRLQADRINLTPNLPLLDLHTDMAAAVRLLRVLGVDQVKAPRFGSGGPPREALQAIAAELGAAWIE